MLETPFLENILETPFLENIGAFLFRVHKSIKKVLFFFDQQLNRLLRNSVLSGCNVMLKIRVRGYNDTPRGDKYQ